MQARAEVGQLPELQHYLQRIWSERQLPNDLLPVFALALEELFINICVHGAPGMASVVVSLEIVSTACEVTMTLTDNAVPFDPTQVHPQKLDAGLDLRPVGGLGIHLVRQSMDRFEYSRDGQVNRVQVSHKLQPSNPSTP
jgi:serine/threonine-protein kinase RsbW